MRRHDKKIAMKKANILFEQRCNENAFSWDGTYANEGDIHGDDNDYNFPYNQADEVNTKDLFNGTDDIEEGTMSLGDDIEVIPEESGKKAAKKDIVKHIKRYRDSTSGNYSNSDNWDEPSIGDTFNKKSGKLNKELNKDYPDLNPYNNNTNGNKNKIKEVDKTGIEEEITNITTDISDETQWFSQVDGERAIDKIFN